MPELPEVETVRPRPCAGHGRGTLSKVEARRGDLRWPLPMYFAARLEGEKVEGLGRRAKYLLVDLSSGDVLLMHLGMSGSFPCFAAARKTPRASITTSARGMWPTTTWRFTWPTARWSHSTIRAGSDR